MEEKLSRLLLCAKHELTNEAYSAQQVRTQTPASVWCTVYVWYAVLFPCALVLLMLAPEFALAAPKKEGYEASIVDLFPYWVNFPLYVLALYFVLRRPLAAAWQVRRASILEQLEQGHEASERARTALGEAKEALLHTPTAIEQLGRTMEGESQREVELLLHEAKERASKIVRSAEGTLAGERKALYDALRREVTEEVLRAAESQIIRSMSVEQEQRLRDVAVRRARELMRERVEGPAA